MITVNRKEAIRRRVKIDGASLSQAAREFGCSRKTVRRALQNASAPTYGPRQQQHRPQLGRFTATIDQWLEEDRERPPKQRHTAKRVYDRLRELFPEFSAGESTVRRYVSEKKKELGLGVQVYLPIHHPPGAELQADWFEARVIIAGIERIVHILLLWMSFSCKLFARAYPAEKQECLLEGLQNGFEYFGGVPHHQVRFDNLKTAVKKILKGRKREEQEQFTAFRSHYLFESSFCTPREPHEKGGVEGSVSYSRRNWFVPIPEFEDYEALNRYLIEKCDAESARRPSRKALTIGEAFERERPHLRPLPDKPFDVPYPCHPKADSLSRVWFDKNFYSVPVGYAYRQMTLRAYPFEVVISYNNRVVARHERLYGTNRESLNPLHYLRLLERKPAGLEVGRPFRNWDLPTIFGTYHRALKAKDEKGTRQYIKILTLLEQTSVQALRKALEESFHARAWGYEAVKMIVERKNGADAPPPIDMRAWPELAAVTSRVPSTQQYNLLLTKG